MRGMGGAPQPPPGSVRQGPPRLPGPCPRPSAPRPRPACARLRVPHLHPQRLHIVGAVRALHKVGQVELHLRLGRGTRAGRRGEGQVRGGGGCVPAPGRQAGAVEVGGPRRDPEPPAAWQQHSHRTWFHPSSRRMGMVQMKGLTRVVDCRGVGHRSGARLSGRGRVGASSAAGHRRARQKAHAPAAAANVPPCHSPATRLVVGGAEAAPHVLVIQHLPSHKGALREGGSGLLPVGPAPPTSRRLQAACHAAAGRPAATATCTQSLDATGGALPPCCCKSICRSPSLAHPLLPPGLAHLQLPPPSLPTPPRAAPAPRR